VRGDRIGRDGSDVAFDRIAGREVHEPMVRLPRGSCFFKCTATTQSNAHNPVYKCVEWWTDLRSIHIPDTWRSTPNWFDS
jgi:hypothetical protein